MYLKLLLCAPISHYTTNDNDIHFFCCVVAATMNERIHVYRDSKGCYELTHRLYMKCIVEYKIVLESTQTLNTLSYLPVTYIFFLHGWLVEKRKRNIYPLTYIENYTFRRYIVYVRCHIKYKNGRSWL